MVAPAGRPRSRQSLDVRADRASARRRAWRRTSGCTRCRPNSASLVDGGGALSIACASAPISRCGRSAMRSRSACDTADGAQWLGTLSPDAGGGGRIAAARAFLRRRRDARSHARSRRRSVRAGPGRGCAAACRRSRDRAAAERAPARAAGRRRRHRGALRPPRSAPARAVSWRWPPRPAPPSLRLSPWRAVYFGCATALARSAATRHARHRPDRRRERSAAADRGLPRRAGLRSRAASMRAATRGGSRAMAAVHGYEGSIHVSGCAKGCARSAAGGPGAGRARRAPIAVMRNATTRDPVERMIGADELATLFGETARCLNVPISATARRSIAGPSPSSAPSPISRASSPAEERGRRAHHPCLRHGRDRARHRHVAGLRRRARWALLAGAPILCDSKMVANGITRAPPAGRQRGRLHARRSVRCRTSRARIGNTRTAAAMELWRDRLAGAVVAIGNAPTALFRLLEMLDAGAPPPAAVIGLPVGFVGAAESKEALAADGRVPFLIVQRPQGRQRHGRGRRQCAGERGGMTSLDDLAGAARRRHALRHRRRAGRRALSHLARGGPGARGRCRRLLRQARPARQCAAHRGAADAGRHRPRCGWNIP